jgi:hypothetical protein
MVAARKSLRAIQAELFWLAGMVVPRVGSAGSDGG